MERSSLSRIWRGLCANSSLLVGDEVRNLCVCVAYEYWGSSVHVFRGELGELSSVFVGLG